MISVAIVEDDELIGQGLRSLLTQCCPAAKDIHVFLSAQEALGYFEAQPFDLLLTDIEMPGVNGLGLFERLHQSCPGLLCIIITGYDSFAYARRGLQLGALDFLLKPVDDEEFGRALEKAQSILCQRAQTEEQLAETSRRLIHVAYHQPEQFSVHLQRLKAQPMTVHDVVRLLELVENALPGLETQREEGLWRRWDALTAYVQAERRTKATLELAEEVAQYIHTHFTQELSINMLASLFHVTPAYLGQVYRKVYGHAIHQALHQARINHAKLLLQDASIPIAQIAAECGYKTIDHFYRQFRRLENETPAGYRARCML